MLLKIQPTVTVTLVCDLRGFVDEDGSIRELAMRACDPVPEGGRVRVDLGTARMDTHRVIHRIATDPVIGWAHAGEVELAGTNLEFLSQVAAWLGDL